MSLINYSENLENFSKRLPFDYTLFLETFADFLVFYNNTSQKPGAKLVYDRYKPIVSYVIRLNSKLIDGSLSFLIPDRFIEFEEVVVYRKNRVLDYYNRGLLVLDEMQAIMHMIDDDRMSILNQAILNRIYNVDKNPTFKGVNDVINFGKLLQRYDSQITLENLYKWRSKTRRRILFSKICCLI